MSLQHVANHLAQQGRGKDSMLVHMTPSEVAGLRSLAHAKGGDLTTNPHTGLPEAGFLDDVIKVAAPLALGAFLGPAGMGLSAGLAGAAVGGIATLATGSLSRGLMAGLGAYGGAGLGGSLADIGAVTPETTASIVGEGASALPGSQAAMLAEQNAGFGVEGAKSLASAAGTTAPTLTQNIGAGVSSLANNPSAIGDFAAKNWKSGLAAVAPIMADKGVQTTTKAPPVDTGYIRQKIFDPTSQRYIDLAPVKASEWGSRSFSDIYQQPAAAATGGIVALAQGGVAHFDGTDGSVVSAAPAAITASDVSNYLQANPGMSDAQIAAAMNQYHVDPGLVAQATGLNVGDVQSRYNAVAPTGGYYTGTSGISNQDIVKALQGQYAGASDATLATAMQNLHIDPTQMAYATGIPLTGEGNIADRYALAQDIMGEGKTLGAYQGPGTPMQNLGSTYDQNWANWMDTHKDPVTGKIDPVAVEEMARVTGISKDEIGKRYAAAEAKLHPVVPVPPVNPTAPKPGTSNVTQTVLPTNPGTNAPAGTTNPYGNINNPGDITKNADGTITVQPNIPGRPYGGYSGIAELTNAYTAGGGSTGYFPQAPKTAAEADAQFNTMTGDSLAAYNFLMGKGAAPLKTTAAQVSRPYSEAVMGIKPVTPTYSASVAKIFDPVTHQIIDNPAYKAAAITGTPSTAGSTLKLPTGGNATFDASSGYYFLNGKYYDKDGKEVQYSNANNGAAAANGGLMGMAMGGLGSLGGYSDGGRLLRGPGDGVSDSIPATIGANGRQPARLADGEFVVPARIVSEIGNGSTEAGARKLYQMMDRVQHARRKTTGKDKVATDTDADKYLPA